MVDVGFLGCDLEILQLFLKVRLCMTNGSKILIYLTLLYFMFYSTLVSNAKGNIAKSNKSELWNLFEVRSQNFRN